MSLKYQFPEEIQSWIIGKRIPGDMETLSHCKIKGPGHSAYLYLRSPKSVGLTKEAYQKRLMAQQFIAGKTQYTYMGLVMRKPVYVVSDQVRPKPVYSATETS